MESFFSRYKNPMVLVLVLALQFVVLAVQVRSTSNTTAHAVDQAGVRAIRLGVATVVTPPEGALHYGGKGLRDLWSHYIGLVGLKQQNDELQEKVQRLELEQAALAEDARQGQRLEELLAFKQNYIYQTVPAQVVGGSGTDRSRILYLDKGADDGIRVEMPVITPDGVVGRIRETFPHSSQVLLISDPTSAAGGLLEDTRTRGVIRGNAAGQPQIVNIMPDDRIKPGQKVVTTGGDQIFPRGLLVGTVERIQTDPENEPMVDVILKPAANLSRLEEVLIVTSTASAPPPKAKTDLAQSESVAAGIAAAKAAAAAAAAAKAQAALDAQRASDVLAQRLPGKNDDTLNPDAPDAAADSSPTTEAEGAKPLHPPSAVHPDHYTPLTVPPADSLTPGKRYAPLAEGTLASVQPKKPEAPARTTTPGEIAGSTASAEGTAAVPASPAPAPRRMITTTLPDGTVVTRPAPVRPAVAPGTATAAGGAAAAATPTAPRRTITTTLPDGTVVTRTVAARPPAAPSMATGTIANPGATSTPAPRRMITTTLADGTVVTRPGPVRPANAAPATGTIPKAATIPRTGTTPVAAGASSSAAPRRTITTVLPNGTVVTRTVPSTGSTSGAATTNPRPAGTANPRPVTPRIVTDGPLPSTRTVPRPPATSSARPQTGAATSATPRPATPVQPRRRTPEIVPDDGSRPPPRQPAPTPQGLR